MSVVEYPSNEHPKKKRYLSPLDNDNMTCVRREIADIKESLAELASEAREDRQNIIKTLEDLDIARTEEMTQVYEAREERDNIYYMLKEILAEIQQRK